MLDACASIPGRPSTDRAATTRVEHYITLTAIAASLRRHQQWSSCRRNCHAEQDQSPPEPIEDPDHFHKTMMARASPEMPSSEPSSTSPSPTLEAQQQYPVAQVSPPLFHLSGPRKTSRTPSMPAIQEDLSSPDVLIDDEARLYDINLEVKSTLTDLLSCESVRCDDKMRMWVQMKLMEAERELKQQRRRRSSGTKSI